MTGWRAALLLAGVIHSVIVFSIITQPLDPHTPPQSPRSLVWRCCYDSVTWPGPGVDFFALYHAGVQSRRGVSPYVQEEAPATTPYYFRYLYAPGLAYTLGAWMSMLAPTSAYRLWAGLVELSLLIVLVAWWRSPADAAIRQFGTVVLLLSTPYFLELHVGQFTFLATSLTATAVLKRPSNLVGRTVAGAYFFSGVFVKLFPLAAVPALLRQRSRAPLVGAAAALLVLLAGLFIHPDASLEVLRLNALDDTTRPHPGHMSLVHLARVGLAAAGLPLSSAAWGLAAPTLMLSGLAILTAIVWRRGLTGVPAFVLMLLGFLLLFYRAGEHHWSAVILLAALGLSYGTPSQLEPREALVGRVCLLLLAAPTPFILLSTDASLWSTAETLLLPALKVFPGLLLFALLLKPVPQGNRPLS